jgi:hypothetical protein
VAALVRITGPSRSGAGLLITDVTCGGNVHDDNPDDCAP